METFEVPVSNIVPMSKSNEIPWWNPNLEVFMRNNISELPPTVVNNLIVITRKIVDERIRSVEEKSKYSNAPSSISLQKLDLEQETDSYAFAILQLHLMSQAAQK